MIVSDETRLAEFSCGKRQKDTKGQGWSPHTAEERKSVTPLLHILPKEALIHAPGQNPPLNPFVLGSEFKHMHSWDHIQTMASRQEALRVTPPWRPSPGKRGESADEYLAFTRGMLPSP